MVLKLWAIFFAYSLGAFESNLKAGGQSTRLVSEFPLVTNILQLRQTVNGNVGSICAFSFEGTVLAADSGSGVIFFQDDSGTEILETSLAGRTLAPGQKIRLRGTNYVASTEIGVSLGKIPLVDNDGRHSKAECTGSVYLRAGRYPIQVLWFNYTGDSSLDVAYSGPNVMRQKIPDSALSRLEKVSSDGAISFKQGVNYCCVEGEWKELSPFQDVTPAKVGVTSNFDLNVKTRDEHVALIFDGFIEINSDGLYTYYLTSDDGSELHINNGPTQLTVLGSGDVPAPSIIGIRQPMPGHQGDLWAEVEGRVNFLGRQQNRTELELTSNDAHMRVTVIDVPQEPPRYLLGSLVRVHGVCLNTSDAAGHSLADMLVVPRWNNLQVLEVAPDFWSVTKIMKVSNCKPPNGEGAANLVHLRGEIPPHSSGQQPDLQDDTGSIPIELLNPLPAQFNGEVECLGRLSQNGSNQVLREAVWREPLDDLRNKNDAIPLLTTAAQVQQLKREEAGRGYQAKIRGVVTWVAANRDCIVIQDSTRGVFVGLRSSWIWDSPKIGEILEIEGTCVAGEFSPIIILNKGERLGMGLLPAPKYPTRGQLIGGSMDSQYVEIRGLVTEAHDSHLTLLMFGGKVDVELDPSLTDSLDSFINSVVSIRGCVFARWSHPTLQVLIDHPLWVGGSTICVDIPPPSDPFDADKMRGRELLKFDAQGNNFRRINISGQVLCDNGGIYYMNDDGFGLQFQLVKPAHFEPGDNVEVVGLVELGGPSPILREAIARKTGHSRLPAPQPLTFDNTNTTCDATRVWAEGVLLNQKDNGQEQMLEMQTGAKGFVARLPKNDAQAGPWPVGSRLKLTGVFSDLGGNSQRAGIVKSFELLLNSPADVELIARPPWWTLNRLLTIISTMGVGLVLASVWINLLRRQVERRTVQLQREISERQLAEQDRAIEQERSRIARDLHDDLGSRLTAINMLAMTSAHTKLSSNENSECLQLIVDKSRSMVTALDALVWAVNPKNDTLAALVDYLASFAEELLAKSGIACRVEVPLDIPERIIAAETRHNLLLSVKEALTNSIRHGRPGEILIQLTVSSSELEILINDNGCGFDPANNIAGDGLVNLKERMRKVNGCCKIQSSSGKGTTVSMTMPL
jgi:signal transduction histidine kinase